MQTVSEAAAYTYNLSTKPTLCFLTGRQVREDHSFKEIIATTHKNTVVVAPTGIAA
jgi:hypothetical protein